MAHDRTSTGKQFVQYITRAVRELNHRDTGKNPVSLWFSSEVQPQLRLERASRVHLSGDVSKWHAAVDVQVRIVRLRVIEDVGRIEPELQRLGLPDLDALGERHIQSPRTRHFNDVLTESST